MIRLVLEIIALVAIVIIALLIGYELGKRNLPPPCQPVIMPPHIPQA